MVVISLQILRQSGAAGNRQQILRFPVHTGNNPYLCQHHPGFIRQPAVSQLLCKIQLLLYIMQSRICNIHLIFLHQLRIGFKPICLRHSTGPFRLQHRNPLFLLLFILLRKSNNPVQLFQTDLPVRRLGDHR